MVGILGAFSGGVFLAVHARFFLVCGAQAPGTPWWAREGRALRSSNDSRFITAIGTVIALGIFSEFFEEVRHREHCIGTSPCLA